MNGLDLIYEWAVDEGYDAVKCDIFNRHECDLVKGRSLSGGVGEFHSTHRPLISINPGVRIYVVLGNQVYVRAYNLGLSKPELPQQCPLNMSNPRFFFELQGIVDICREIKVD